MQTIRLNIEVENDIYDKLKETGININSKIKEFIHSLVDDGYPAISYEEAQQRVSKAIEEYKNGSMQTVSHKKIWQSIKTDCNAKLENRV